jgi:hypothetical protein
MLFFSYMEKPPDTLVCVLTIIVLIKKSLFTPIIVISSLLGLINFLLFFIMVSFFNSLLLMSLALLTKITFIRLLLTRKLFEVIYINHLLKSSTIIVI